MRTTHVHMSKIIIDSRFHGRPGDLISSILLIIFIELFLKPQSTKIANMQCYYDDDREFQLRASNIKHKAKIISTRVHAKEIKSQ
jgi:hypothetical protein